MADQKPSLFKRVIQTIGGPLIKAEVERQVQTELSKASAGDVVRFSPRQLIQPGGSLRKPYPLGVTFQALRDFADYYPIARACIEFRKAQITHLDWNAAPGESTYKAYSDKKNIDDAKKSEVANNVSVDEIHKVDH